MPSSKQQFKSSTTMYENYDQIVNEFLDSSIFYKARLVFKEDNAGYFLKIFKTSNSERLIGVQIFKSSFILDIKSIPNLANMFNEIINKLNAPVDVFFDLRGCKFKLEMSEVLRGDLAVNPLMHVVRNDNLGAIITLTSHDAGYGAINMFLSLLQRSQ